MLATLFLATNRPGITRAVLRDGAWQTEQVMPDLDARCFALDPADSQVVLAGTQDDGLWRSADQGQTWQPHALEGMTIKSIAFSLSDPAIIYAGIKPPAIWKSEDGGTTWTECERFQAIPSLPDWWSPAEPPGTAYVQGLSVHPHDPKIVLAGIEYGAVVRSEDGGASWSDHRDEAIHDCHTLMFHPVYGEYAYEGGGSGEGGAISTDGGLTWDQPTAGLDGRHYGWACAADPTTPTTWYVAVSPGPGVAHQRGTARAGIFRMREGEAWQRLSGGLPEPIPDMPYALIADRRAAGHLYAGLRSGDIWFSADSGDTWQKLPLNVGHLEYSLVLVE